MKKVNIILLAVIGVIIVIAAVVLLFGYKSPNSSTSPSSSSSQSSTQASATITYSDSGFSPDATTVKAGSTVAIKNASSSVLQFDSDPHPVHTDDTDLNVGTVEVGQTKTFTVTKTGSFGFHNHLDPSKTGKIVIQ